MGVEITATGYLWYLLIIILHACARGKVIGSIVVVAVVNINIARSRHLGSPKLHDAGAHGICGLRALVAVVIFGMSLALKPTGPEQ